MKKLKFFNIYIEDLTEITLKRNTKKNNKMWQVTELAQIISVLSP